MSYYFNDTEFYEEFPQAHDTPQMIIEMPTDVNPIWKATDGHYYRTYKNGKKQICDHIDENKNRCKTLANFNTAQWKKFDGKAYCLKHIPTKGETKIKTNYRWENGNKYFDMVTSTHKLKTLGCRVMNCDNNASGIGYSFGMCLSHYRNSINNTHCFKSVDGVKFGFYEDGRPIKFCDYSDCKITLAPSGTRRLCSIHSDKQTNVDSINSTSISDNSLEDETINELNNHSLGPLNRNQILELCTRAEKIYNIILELISVEQDFENLIGFFYYIIYFEGLRPGSGKNMPGLLFTTYGEFIEKSETPNLLKIHTFVKGDYPIHLEMYLREESAIKVLKKILANKRLENENTYIFYERFNYFKANTTFQRITGNCHLYDFRRLKSSIIAFNITKYFEEKLSKCNEQDKDRVMNFMRKQINSGSSWITIDVFDQVIKGLVHHDHCAMFHYVDLDIWMYFFTIFVPYDQAEVYLIKLLKSAWEHITQEMRKSVFHAQIYNIEHYRLCPTLLEYNKITDEQKKKIDKIFP
jgi:hypothetical protein